MLKCWEADVDSRFSFQEIVTELTRETCEIHTAESSSNKGNVDEQANSKQPCEVKITVIESFTDNDYVTIAKNSSDSTAATLSDVAEPAIVSSEERIAENCASNDYVTVMSYHEIDS